MGLDHQQHVKQNEMLRLSMDGSLLRAESERFIIVFSIAHADELGRFHKKSRGEV